MRSGLLCVQVIVVGNSWKLWRKTHFSDLSEFLQILVFSIHMYVNVYVKLPRYHSSIRKPCQGGQLFHRDCLKSILLFYPFHGGIREGQRRMLVTLRNFQFASCHLLLCDVPVSKTLQIASKSAVLWCRGFLRPTILYRIILIWHRLFAPFHVPLRKVLLIRSLHVRECIYVHIHRAIYFESGSYSAFGLSEDLIISRSSIL